MSLQELCEKHDQILKLRRLLPVGSTDWHRCTEALDNMEELMAMEQCQQAEVNEQELLTSNTLNLFKQLFG